MSHLFWKLLIWRHDGSFELLGNIFWWDAYVKSTLHYVVPGSVEGIYMPLHIEKGKIWSGVTDASRTNWLTDFESSSFLAPWKYKSGALVTQCLTSLYKVSINNTILKAYLRPIIVREQLLSLSKSLFLSLSLSSSLSEVSEFCWQIAPTCTQSETLSYRFSRRVFHCLIPPCLVQFFL